MSEAEKRNPKDTAPQEADSMTVVGHLQELRKRLTVVLVVLFAAFIGVFVFIRPIAEYVLRMGLGEGFTFVYLSPSELLTSYFKLSLIAALMITAPTALYEIWMFLAPAVDEPERRKGWAALAAGFVFFLIGCVFAYLVALPFMVQFLVNFNTSEFIQSSISVESYLNFVIRMVLVFGLVFEMPIVAYLLSTLGILKPGVMQKARKYAILLIFIVAAIITPPDVVSQIMIAFPMILLYEISIAICKAVTRAKARREAAEEKS